MEVGNWVDLPRDVLILIFAKLGAFDILFSAQMVCSSWWELSKDPQFFRCIDMCDNTLWRYWGSTKEWVIQRIAMQAVDRSCGGLVEFSIRYFGTNQLLHYIAISYGLAEVARKNVLLEEVDLCFTSHPEEAIIVIGCACPQLKSIRLDCRGFDLPNYSPINKLEWNLLPFFIPRSMPQLRRLHLFRNKLSDVGLREILDGCPALEYLDLRQCFNIVDSHLLRTCEQRIHKLRLVHDSLEDNEFDPQYFFYPPYYEECSPSHLSDKENLAFQ
ncbi:hypothetical protein ACHQM5_002990 [Ranunculus cassubicifolius]